MTARPFDEFYVDEYAAVVRLTTALTGRRELGEELAQETFLTAFRRWSRVGNLEDPAGWVRRVATNRCVSSGRRHVTELRLLARLRVERPSAGGPKADIDEELWAAVRNLPRRQAQVIALRFVEDLSVDDIARILECGPETVRTHLRRGRLRVAEQLGVATPEVGEDDDDATG